MSGQKALDKRKLHHSKGSRESSPSVVLKRNLVQAFNRVLHDIATMVVIQVEVGKVVSTTVPFSQGV
ncbi:hypothetical protein RIF29_29360 [Crotalaria pallida]|uniref:Uncharacterized protein n=1 Tax=Crotalaria pallida TaxID=3830 RepID=A0AAN9EEE2_CROPI